MTAQTYKILLVEDDAALRFIIRDNLEIENYQVDIAEDGETALQLFNTTEYALLILDVMLPRKDGFTVAREIRKVNDQIPILFLTARSMNEDKITGLTLGGDDYITKPFSMEELIFRIEAILRRAIPESQNLGQQIYKLGRYTFDARKQTLANEDDIVKLTTKEAELLKLLCQNINKVLERNFALKSIWIDDNYFNARSMDVYITKLRKHLKDEPTVEIINVHGKGYKLIM